MNWNTEGKETSTRTRMLFSTAPMKCAIYPNTQQKTMRDDVCRRAVTAVSRIKGNEEVCQDLFYSLEWTYPITLLEEWNSNGYFDEIEGWYDD